MAPRENSAPFQNALALFAPTSPILFPKVTRLLASREEARAREPQVTWQE